MSNNVENYLVLGQNALDGNNYIECDNYANKVLEIDSVNTDAYLLKVKALLIKQRYGYNEDEHKIHKHKFIDNIEKQKSSCYSVMIHKCEFSEKHIQSIMDFVMDDFFGEEYSFMNQKFRNKSTSIDLLVHTLRKVCNSTDDKIIESFLGLYEKARQDDEAKAKIFLKSCIVNYKYELTDQEIGEKFYRELIKIKIYDVLYNSPEINYTIKELIEDSDCINSIIGLDEDELVENKYLPINSKKLYLLSFSKLFGQSTINSILDNISYTGVLKSGDTVSKIHPQLQIIKPFVFESVQRLRRERCLKDTEIKKKSTMSCNDISDVPSFGKGLVSGIIHCDCCGAKLRTKSTRLNGHKPISAENPRIPTYVCENRLYEGKKEKICISDDVQTQYRAYKIDDVIDEMIKQLLRRTKALQSGQFINYKYQMEWKRIQGNLNHAKTLYRKKQNEIRSMENKIIRTSQTDEDMKLLLPILKRLKEEAEPLFEQVQKCETDFAELQKNCYEIEQEYNNIIKWADIYENADLPTKQIIVAHLIDSISVKKGYELTVNLKINLEQFESGLEFQALSS